MINLICSKCGEEITDRTQRRPYVVCFDCKKKAKDKYWKNRIYFLNCVQCSSSFEAKYRRKYCSLRCRHDVNNLQIKKRRKKLAKQNN